MSRMLNFKKKIMKSEIKTISKTLSFEMLVIFIWNIYKNFPYFYRPAEYFHMKVFIHLCYCKVLSKHLITFLGSQ